MLFSHCNRHSEMGPAQGGPAEDPLSHPELLSIILSYLSWRDLVFLEYVNKELRRMIGDEREGAQWEMALWQTFSSSCERHTDADLLTSETSAFDRRTECRERMNACYRWSSTGRNAQARAVLEVPGDVVLAVASTCASGPFICAGEAGDIYFIQPPPKASGSLRKHSRGSRTDDAGVVGTNAMAQGPPPVHDGNGRLLFQYNAHVSTILSIDARKMAPALEAPTEGMKYLVASGCVMGSVRLDMVTLTADDRSPPETTQLGLIHLGSGVSALAFALNTRHVVAGMRNGMLATMSTCSCNLMHQSDASSMEGEEPPLHSGHGGQVSGLAVVDMSHDKALLASVSAADSTLHVAEIDSEGVMTVVWRVGKGVLGEVSATNVALRGDGMLAVGLEDGTVAVADAIAKRMMLRVGAHGDEVWDARWCGPLLFTSSRDKSVAAHMLTRSTASAPARAEACDRQEPQGESDEGLCRVSDGDWRRVVWRAEEAFRYQSGWVLRIKPAFTRVLIMGFDAKLLMVEL